MAIASDDSFWDRLLGVHLVGDIEVQNPGLYVVMIAVSVFVALSRFFSTSPVLPPALPPTLLNRVIQKLWLIFMRGRG